MRQARSKQRSFQRSGGPVFILSMLLWLLSGVGGASAQGTPLRLGLIVEEPFGSFGTMMPQGHASLYLSGMCADTPLALRPCRTDEHGVVISRLHDLKQPDHRPNLDWMAVPLFPFLYGVNDPADAPKYLTQPMIEDLREHYRHDHLQLAVADRFNKHGAPVPAAYGDWSETVGASFDRRLFLYMFDITLEQQTAVVDALLSRPNVTEYSVARHNCADLVWKLLEPVMPGVLHRNTLADFDMMTPKQLSWQTTLWLRGHPELHPELLEIPQLPGSVRRSRPIRGAAESLITTKRYFAVVVLLQPELMLADVIIYEKRGKWKVGTDTHPVQPGYWSERLLVRQSEEGSPETGSTAGSPTQQ